MDVTINTLHKDLQTLQREIALIKNALLNEGKLTPWAQEMLAEARAEKEEDYTSLEEL